MENIIVEYNGEYPNLCSGKLIIYINNKKYQFPDYCLSSGGSVGFDEDWNEIITTGKWTVSSWPKDIPNKFKNKVLEAINATIPFGCCGGCV